MAVEPENDELLLDQEQGEGGNADEQGQEEQEQGSNEPGDEGDEELEIGFDGEAAPASGERETELVKHLRAEVRRRDKELAEARKSPPQNIEAGPKPDLWEDCEGDSDKYDAAMDEWRERVAAVNAQQTAGQQQNRAAEEAWQADVQRFESRKAELKVPGAEEAIETALASLNQVQAAVIVKAADNPALVLCALGQHPGKLAEIASIQDPLKQAVAVAKLEGTLKVAPRRKAPEPEEIASGNAAVKAKTTDKEAERLEKRAIENGGDVSDLLRRNREKRRATQAK